MWGIQGFYYVLHCYEIQGYYYVLHCYEIQGYYYVLHCYEIQGYYYVLHCYKIQGYYYVLHCYEIQGFYYVLHCYEIQGYYYVLHCYEIQGYYYVLYDKHFLGDLTSTLLPVVKASAVLSQPVKFFSKLNYCFLGFFDPIIYIFFIIQINNFQCDLSDISDKTASLVPTRQHADEQWCRFSRNIAEVTPKIIYFYYQKIYIQDKSIQKINYLILKKTSLLMNSLLLFVDRTWQLQRL